MLNSFFMDKPTNNRFFEKLKTSLVVRRYKELRKKSGQKVLVFLFFVAISTLIWFFNALGKDYSTYISFPVRYNNIPAGKVLVNKLPERLLLRVNAKGNTIFKYKLGSNINPVVFDVKSFAPDNMTQSGKQEFFVLTSLARERLQGQLNQDIQITDIEPDTLFFKFANTLSKTVNVTADVSVSLKKQYMQKGDIRINPDSITISGPGNIIDTINTVTTEFYHFKNIEDTVSKTLDIIPINNVKFSEDEARVTINVERFTESEVQIPVRVINLPDTIQLKTFPRQVTVTFRVGLTDYEKISPEMFRAVVKFDSVLLYNPPKKLDVHLERYPGFITTVNYNPTSVDFILEK